MATALHRNAEAKTRSVLQAGKDSTPVSGRRRSTFVTSFNRTTSRMKATNHFSRRQPTAHNESGTG